MSLKSLIFGTKETEDIKYNISANTRDWLPIQDIRNGIVQLKDGRFIKLVEVTPVNFYLKSYREQEQIISGFASYLKIAPDNLQIRVLTQKADLDASMSRMWEHYDAKDKQECRKMIENGAYLLETLAQNQTLRRRFFLVFQHISKDWDTAYSSLEKYALDAVGMLEECGLEVALLDNDATYAVFEQIINKKSSHFLTLDDVPSDKADNLAPGMADTSDKHYVVAAAFIAFAVLPRFYADREATTTVYRAASDITKGTLLEESHIAAVEVGAFNLPATVITDPAELIGQYAISDIPKDDLFMPKKISEFLFTETLDILMKKGQRLVTVTVPSIAAGLSGHLEAGDVVSVVSYVEAHEMFETDPNTGFDRRINIPSETVIYDELRSITVYGIENAKTMSMDDARADDSSSAEDTRELHITTDGCDVTYIHTSEVIYVLLCFIVYPVVRRVGACGVQSLTYTNLPFGTAVQSNRSKKAKRWHCTAESLCYAACASCGFTYTHEVRKGGGTCTAVAAG